MMYDTMFHVAEMMAQDKRKGRHYEEHSDAMPGVQPEQRSGSRKAVRLIVALAGLTAAAAIAF